jgi:hypothetical protein
MATLGENEWLSRPGFDFVSSEYKEGFAPDPYPDRGNPAQVDMSISHRRAIFYVKPGYWILCDLVRGDRKTHTLEQIFHLAPVATGNPAEPLQAGLVSAAPSAIVTQNAGVANIAILAVDAGGLDVRAQKGEVSPAVGWYGVYGEFPAWDVTLQAAKTLPARLDAVLYPLAAGTNAYPRITRLRSDERVTALRIQSAGIDDTFILCEDGAGRVTIAGVTFEGRALLVRRQPVVRCLAVAPLYVRVDGQEPTMED